MKRASGLTSLVSSSAIFSSVHLGERARRWRRLAGAVAAPAGDGAIGSEPAGVISAGAHLGERAHARRRLTEILSPESLAPSDVAAPASDRAVGAKSAAVVAPRAHLRDGARREQDQLRLRLGPGVGKVGLAGDGEDEPTQTQQANSAYGVLQRHGCRRSSVLSPAEPSCNVWAWANRCLQGGAPRAACRARGDHAARVVQLSGRTAGCPVATAPTGLLPRAGPVSRARLRWRTTGCALPSSRGIRSGSSPCPPSCASSSGRRTDTVVSPVCGAGSKAHGRWAATTEPTRS